MREMKRDSTVCVREIRQEIVCVGEMKKRICECGRNEKRDMFVCENVCVGKMKKGYVCVCVCERLVGD